MKSIIKSISTLGFALGLSGAAFAVPITGQLNFAGTYTAANGNLLTSNNVLTFGSTTTLGPGSGSFAGISTGTAVTTATSLLTNQAGNVVTVSPGPLVWSVGGFTFNVTSIFETSNSATSIGFFAFGTISGAGFDNTAGTWESTFQNAAGSGTNVNSTFSASSGVPAPDGGSTAAFLGLALLGLAWFAKRKA